MAEGHSIDQLRLRKQVLLLESGINRIELGREIDETRGHFAWLNDPVAAAKENSALLVTLAPLAGLLASRLLRSSGPGASKFTLLVDALRIGWPLWRQFASGYFRDKTR